MIFHQLGHVVRRGWALLLVGWALLALGTWYAAPPWSEVAQDREFEFLPEDTPSRRAAEIYAQAFPTDHGASNIVLVLSRSGGGPEQERGDRSFIDQDLFPRLRALADEMGGLANQPAASDEPLFDDDTESKKPEAKKPAQQPMIASIRTPNALGSGALLVSPDKQAMLVVIDLTTEFLSHRNWSTIGKVENVVEDLRREGKVPAGLDITMTGSAVIGRDHSLAELQSVRATEVLTVVLVVVLLVLIYRAPLLAVIPLATVYLAVRVAVNILAILAGAGHLVLFEGIQIYVTILAYGAGVDYCLFLTARYKEELDRGADPAEAVDRAVGGVGAALVASAATVICGIGMMYFARFGKFSEAGLAIPLSLALVLLATLTFSPALLRLAGRWAFWPYRTARPTGDNAAARGRPGLWDWLVRGDALHWIWEKVGHALLRRPGAIWLGTVALMVPFVVLAGVLYNHVSYDLIGELPATAPSVAATRVLQQHFPAGVLGPVTALAVNENVDFASEQGRAAVRELTDRLSRQREQLGLADIRSLTAPLGVTVAAGAGFENSDLPEETRQQATKESALKHYDADLGGRKKIATRLDLVLKQSPFSRESIDNLERVEQAVCDALPAGMRQGTTLYFAGTTPSVRDLALVMQGDRTRIDLLVVGSVLLILIVLLRGFLVPLYLLVSVLFSYFFTLGVTFAVFWALDPAGFAGIDFKVAIFLFTILIAVGEDYNIFLLTRIHEEQRSHGPVEGTTEALARTGPIISSCGIIMAGTFGSLLVGTLTEMKQLGFALAFGVLLDTFVVRPILVPAFLILLHRRWPEARDGQGRLRFLTWLARRRRTGQPAGPG